MNVGFVVDKEALAQVFPPVLLFSPVSVIPPVLHTNLHIHLVFATKERSRTLGTSKHSNAFYGYQRAQ